MARTSCRKMRYERFLGRKQHRSQMFAIHFVDLGPAANSPVFCITSRTGCSTARRIHTSRIMARSDLERIARKHEVNLTGKSCQRFCELQRMNFGVYVGSEGQG